MEDISRTGNFSILICTGHTGGHFFPACRTAEIIKERCPGAEIHISVPKRPSFLAHEDTARPFVVHELSISAYSKLRLFTVGRFLLECASSVVKMARFLIWLRPRVVIGFGSYGSVIGCLIGFLRGCPVLIHEQNASAGKANLFLSALASKVAVSFPKTDANWAESKVVWTGYPLRSGFLEGSQDNAAPDGEKKFRILVFGGSQGAQIINDIFLDCLAQLPLIKRRKIAVIHVVGDRETKPFETVYRSLDVDAIVYTFFENFSLLLNQADLVISRSGAGTIFELAATGKASILIPYPHANAHQRVNAKYLEDRGMAIMIEQPDLNVLKLQQQITDLMEQPERLLLMGKLIKKLHNPNAASLMADLGLKLI